MQVDVAPANSQLSPHLPQFAVVPIGVSQPGAGVQSAYPGLHFTISHDPAVQVDSALSSAHGFEHAPQLRGSVFRLTH